MSIKRYEQDYDGTLIEVKGGSLMKSADHAAEVARLNEQLQALAVENSALINSSVSTLLDGRPPHGFYASEWFIAKLKNGQYAALKALPEEFSHDYRTNDETYYTKDWVVGWMQTPDTDYRPNVETPTTDAILREIRMQVRAEGIHFAANRLLAAWESGFVSDTPAMAHDISGAILSALEFLPNADEGEFKRDYADEVRARIRAGEVPNV